MPFHVFQRESFAVHIGIICGSGSLAVQFEDHFPSGDHLGSGIICGAVKIVKREVKSSNPICVCFSCFVFFLIAFYFSAKKKHLRKGSVCVCVS